MTQLSDDWLCPTCGAYWACDCPLPSGPPTALEALKVIARFKVQSLSVTVDCPETVTTLDTSTV